MNVWPAVSMHSAIWHDTGLGQTCAVLMYGAKAGAGGPFWMLWLAGALATVVGLAGLAVLCVGLEVLWFPLAIVRQ